MKNIYLCSVKDVTLYTTIKDTNWVTRSTVITVNSVNVIAMLTSVYMMLTLTFSLTTMTLVEEVCVRIVNTTQQDSSVTFV